MANGFAVMICLEEELTLQSQNESNVKKNFPMKIFLLHRNQKNESALMTHLTEE